MGRLCMAVIVLAIVVCMTTMPRGVSAVYEEQAGEIDWVKENIGSVTRSKFSGSADDLIYAVTDKGVVACLHETTGSVKWRVRSPSSGAERFHDLLVGSAALYTVSSPRDGSGGMFARAWSLAEGYLLWETKLTNYFLAALSVVDVSFNSRSGDLVVMCNSNLYSISVSSGEVSGVWSASADRDAKGVMESQARAGFRAELSQLVVSSPALDESGNREPSMQAVGCFVKSAGESSECSKAFVVSSSARAGEFVLTLLPDMPSVLFSELRAKISLPSSAFDGKWSADDMLFGPSQKDGKVMVLPLRATRAVPVDLGEPAGALAKAYLLEAGSGAAPVVASCTKAACSTYLLSLDSRGAPSAVRISGSECDVSRTRPAPLGVGGVHLSTEGSSFASSVQASVSCAAFASEVSSSTVVVEVLSLNQELETRTRRATYDLPSTALSRISHIALSSSLSALVVDGAGFTAFISAASTLLWTRAEQLCDTKQAVMAELPDHVVKGEKAIHDVRSRLELQRAGIEEYYISTVAFVTDLPGFFADYVQNIKETISKALLPAPAKGDLRATSLEKQLARKQLKEQREKMRMGSAPSHKHRRFGFGKVAVCLSLRSSADDENTGLSFVDASVRVSILDLYSSTVLWAIEPELPAAAAAGKVIFAKIVESPTKRGSLDLVVSMASGDIFVWELDLGSRQAVAASLRLAPAAALPPAGPPATSIFALQNTQNTRLENRLLLVRIPADSANAIVTVYPSLSGGVARDVFLHALDRAAGSLRIFVLNNHSSVVQTSELATTLEALQVSAVHFQEEVLDVVYPTAGDVVDKRFSVLGDDSILLKYLNPHVALVLSQGNATLFASVVDTASGKIVYRIAHESGAAPVHAVLVENVCVYTYWNDNARRTELSTVALYEGMIDKYGLNPMASAKGSPVLQQVEREAHFSSFTSTPPLGMQKTYILPKSVTAIHHTITAHGIANKNVLLALSTGQLFSVDMRQLHPRRPFAEPTQFEKEEGLAQYNPFLQLSPLQAVTYDGVVEGGIRSIVAAPTKLESTSLVLSFGDLDMHYNHVMPSQGFDLLASDFNHGLLFTILAALALAALALRRLAKTKQLNAAWK